MGIATSVRIDIADDDDADRKGRQLLEWLSSYSELWVSVDQGPSGIGHRGEQTAVTLVVMLGAGRLRVLAAAILDFMRVRDDTNLRITAGSRTIYLNGRSGTFDKESLVEAMRAPDGGGASVLDRQYPSLETRTSNRWQFASDPTGAGRTVLGSPGRARNSVPDRAAASKLEITIYLSDEGDHERVEDAVERALAAAGLHVEDRDDPILGSWFRRMWAGVADNLRTPSGREAMLVAAHAAETRLVLAPDADVTSKLLQSIGPVIASLGSIESAVIRLGNVLIVKTEDAVSVSQLTPAQQFLLNHHPELACAPHRILEALKRTDIEGDDGPAALE
ncbi:hypothetical protein [Amycolatopsis sp. NPDC004169]|uniref:effector-associated constant component EACC1 n=1 Tax=Amycolatopsis sp. NPDC004169 TaxID=3154453 RepID=UPI0033BB9D89